MQSSLFQDMPAGATITGIQPSPSDPNQRRVRVGKKIVATLRAADVEELGLAIGMAWTDALAHGVQQKIAVNKARKTAMSLLGRRPYSRGELIERLTRKGHDGAVSRRIAEEMAANHWIDDAAYARTIVHEVICRKPASAKLLKMKLRARKIEPELAGQITREALAGVDPIAGALNLAKRRFATMHSLPAATAQRRIGDLLTRRGFDEQIIEQVWERLGLGRDQSLD